MIHEPHSGTLNIRNELFVRCSESTLTVEKGWAPKTTILGMILFPGSMTLAGIGITLLALTYLCININNMRPQNWTMSATIAAIFITSSVGFIASTGILRWVIWRILPFSVRLRRGNSIIAAECLIGKMKYKSISFPHPVTLVLYCTCIGAGAWRASAILQGSRRTRWISIMFPIESENRNDLTEILRAIGSMTKESLGIQSSEKFERAIDESE